MYTCKWTLRYKGFRRWWQVYYSGYVVHRWRKPGRKTKIAGTTQHSPALHAVFKRWTRAETASILAEQRYSQERRLRSYPYMASCSQATAQLPDNTRIVSRSHVCKTVGLHTVLSWIATKSKVLFLWLITMEYILHNGVHAFSKKTSSWSLKTWSVRCSWLRPHLSLPRSG